MRALLDCDSKTCTKCGETKSIDMFAVHKGCKGGYNTRCKRCVADNSKEWTRKNLERKKATDSARSPRMKLKAIEYMGGKCADCNKTYPQCVYQFHHLDPTQKDMNPSRAFGYTWERCKVGLDKCVMLCANCHMIRHHGGGE